MEHLTTLEQWLAHCERLHPSTIDMGLERLRAVAQRMHDGQGVRFCCPVFVVAGTNGKGSTCAMLESILRHAGYCTGLFTSPHLVRFEERCQINREPLDAAALLPHFAAVEAARGDISLSYFEFTTLAILDALAAAALDVAILEVGLGGRLDAVNIIDADCAIITSIDIDHVEYLGSDRETIGREKAGIMRAGRPVVVSDPAPPTSVHVHAQTLGADLWQAGRDFVAQGDAQQWGWVSSTERGGRRYSGLAYPALRGANQLVNAAGVLAALAAMRDVLPVPAHAVRMGFSQVQWPGRFQIVPGQPTLVLDVAHNPHSVAALVANLDAMPYAPCTHVVFGAMADKDLPDMLVRLHPLVDCWYFTDLPTARAQSAQVLHQIWKDTTQQLPARALPVQTDMFASPHQALHAALERAQPTDRIIVCGSFFTVGDILSRPLPKLAAPHTAAAS